MSEPQPEVKIIKKKERYATSHGSGPWKLAYADLMTAMMAFFFLMRK